MRRHPYASSQRTKLAPCGRFAERHGNKLRRQTQIAPGDGTRHLQTAPGRAGPAIRRPQASDNEADARLRGRSRHHTGPWYRQERLAHAQRLPLTGHRTQCRFPLASAHDPRRKPKGFAKPLPSSRWSILHPELPLSPGSSRHKSAPRVHAAPSPGTRPVTMGSTRLRIVSGGTGGIFLTSAGTGRPKGLRDAELRPSLLSYRLRPA